MKETNPIIREISDSQFAVLGRKLLVAYINGDIPAGGEITICGIEGLTETHPLEAFIEHELGIKLPERKAEAA